MSSSRQYDIVVFGATGYTGKLTAEHISTNLPTNLKWALAGRSSAKLEAVAKECKTLNENRLQPGIEICNLNDADLTALAKKTTILISTVGPYALYGEHAFKACAENGTHYLDVTGEVPFVAEMIKKYGKIAQKNGAIMIPQIGIESAPPDLITWTLVDMIKKRYDAPTGEVSVSIYALNSAPSGGTLATVLNITDSYSLKELGAAHKPYAISPIAGPKSPQNPPFLNTLFGVRAIPDLGIQTRSLGGAANVPIIHRSWGLLGGSYGPRFSYNEYMKARNYLTALVFSFSLTIVAVLLPIPIFRSLCRRFIYQPGEGPTKEEYQNDLVEYRGVAIPDVPATDGKPVPRPWVCAQYNGSLYALTGVLAAEAAMTILKDDHNLKGDVYTPACLGQKFIDRVQEGGFKFETKFLE